MAANAEADGGKPGGTIGRTIIAVAQKHHRKDRCSADVEKRFGKVVPVRRAVQELLPQKIGMTMSLEIMIDSATEATITMAVAAENPPMKVISETTGI